MENPEVKLINVKPETICCNTCKRPLINFWRYAEVADAEVSNEISATCPFCNGQSNSHIIYGFYRIGPIGSDESNNPTVIQNIETVEDNKYKVILNAKR